MTNIKLFQDKKIRSVWNDDEEQWYFVVEDVVAALTDSADPKQYVKRMTIVEKLTSPLPCIQVAVLLEVVIVHSSGGKS